jgi:uncharacterized Zn finger protein
VTEKPETVAISTRKALQSMGFEERRSAVSDGVNTIWAGSPKRKVRVRLTAIAENTTRIRIDVDQGWIFSDDPATASEVMIQIEVALGNI